VHRVQNVGLQIIGQLRESM